MGLDTMYTEGDRHIPPYGGLKTYGAATAEGTGQSLGFPPSRGCDGGGGVIGGGDLRLSPPEHRGEIYCD